MTTWLWRAAWLLVPVAWAAHRLAPERPVLAFALACLSLVPLAREMGDATESLAERLGPSAGALLNSTFGNAAELIIGITALKAGHVDLVKGSITGSILGNLLLVAGGAITVGGLRFDRLHFSRVGAGASISTLFLAVVALATPAMLGNAAGRTVQVRALSECIAVVLLVMYALSLTFSLRTQARVEPASTRAPLAATPAEAVSNESQRPAPAAQGPVWRPLAALLLSAAATAIASEVLVGALEGTLSRLHLPEIFVGVVIVAVVGNAAEHSTALLFGRRGEMDVALGIAWESSKQIALFVAPVLVFVGVLLGQPMDLAFSAFEVVAVALAVIATALIASDGETHWLEGAFLLGVYLVLAIGFYFVP